MSDTEESQTIELNTKGLDQLLKSFRNPPSIRIGILGTKTNRSGKGATTNATVGAAHEFGTEKLPVRSFLRIPLTDQLDNYLEKAGAFDETVLKDVVRSGSLVEFAKKIATVAERVVLDAFDTSGFGKWQPSNMAHKKVQQTLVETQQLRNSITSEVKE